MRTKKIPISIIVPTIGRPKYLSICILSLAKQTVLPEEIIVVDNSDKSVSNKIKILLKKIRPLLSGVNLKHIIEKSRGVSYARNAGIRKARCDLFAFIDDDCIAKRDWIEQIIKSTAKNKKALIQGKNMNGLPNNIYSCVEYYNSELFFQSGLYKSFKRIYYPSALDTKNCVIRKSLFSKFPYFDTRFEKFSDIDFGFRLLRRGIKIVFDKNLVVWHSARTNFISHIIREISIGSNNYRFQKKWQRHLIMSDAVPHDIQKTLGEIRRKKVRKLAKSLKRKILMEKPILFKFYFHLLLYLNYLSVSTGYYFQKYAELIRF